MGNKHRSGICKLCQEEKSLCYSHIIPKFIFKKLKHGTKDFIAIKDGKNKAIKVQREFREYLLCSKCEKLIGKNETYASNTLYNFKKFTKMDGDKITIQNVNYDKFKLFQLSILWRGSISSYDIFKDGRLEPALSERLRLMILNQNPGEEYEFGCRLFGITLQNQLLTHLYVNPGNYPIRSILVIYHTFGGFRWHFVVKEEMDKIPYRYWSINKKSELVFILKDMFEFPDFTKFISNNFPTNLSV